MARSDIGLWFLTLAALFLILAISEGRQNRGQQSPRRRAWLRIAVVFGAVGMFLVLGIDRMRP
jgi:hypothetical protein